MQILPLSATAELNQGTTTADYVLQGAKWGPNTTPGTPGGVVTYSFATGDYPGQPFHFDAPPLAPVYQIAVRSAFATWSEIGNIAFREVADSPASDIRIGWQAIDGPYKVLAQTTYSYDMQGHMLNAWIGFDDSESYTLAGPNGSPALSSGFMFEAVAEHEIGHAIGIGHYNDAPAIMNAILSVGSLQTSDVDAIHALYGAAPVPIVANAAAADGGAEELGMTGGIGNLLGMPGHDDVAAAHAHHHTYYDTDWLLA
jgi:hypothetical protein